MLKNFSREELECNCGCGACIEDEVFLNNLQRLREMYCKPMTITSAKRCPEYNDRVSTTGLNGPHTKAAVDVLCYDGDAFDLLWLAIATGFTGIGIKQTGRWSSRYIHLDRRPHKWIWTY